MRIVHIILFFVALLLFGSISYGQDGRLVPLPGTRPIDTAWAGRSVRVDSVLRLLMYATADSEKVLGIDANGKVTLRDKGVPWSEIVDYVVANFQPRNVRVIYLSQIPGIPLEEIINGETAINDYAQPILTSADDYGTMEFHIDIPYAELDSELRYKSNTKIIGHNTRLFMRANVRQPFFINWNASATEQLDSNIYIGGFYFDGNGMNNIDSVNAYVTRDNSIICGVAAFGVKNIVQENNTYYDIPAWGIAYSGVTNFVLRNLEGITPDDTCTFTIPGTGIIQGQKRLSGDLVNFRGGCAYGWWENLRSNAYDDVMAFNNILYDLPGAEYINNDPTHDIYGSGLEFVNSSLGVAVYTTDSSVYNLGFNNLHGKVQWRWFAITSHPGASGAMVHYDKGDARNITVTNVDVEKIAPQPNTYNYTLQDVDEMVRIDADCEGVVFDNINLRKWDRYIGSIRQKPGFTINGLKITNYHEHHDKDTAIDKVRLIFDGTVNNGAIVNATFTRSAGISQAGKFLRLAAGNQFSVNGVLANNIDTLLTTSGANLEYLNLANIMMDSCATNGALLDITSSSATVVVTTSNINSGITPVLAGGGAANLIANGLFVNKMYGTHDFQDPRGSTGRGVRIVSSAGAFYLIADAGGWSLQQGVIANDRTTVLGGTFYNGSASTLTNIRIGSSNSTYGIEIATPGNTVTMPNAVTMGSTASIGGNLTVTGTTTINNVTTITGPLSGEPLIMRRDNNAVGAFSGSLLQLKNSSSAYTTYGAFGVEIGANTAGAVSGNLVYYTVNAGSLAARGKMLANGNMILGTTFTDDGARLQLVDGDLSTGQPTANGKGKVKFGKIRTGSDANTYWEIEVDGTDYYIRALTALP